MAGRNITPNLLPPTTATITVLMSARAHHSRGSRFNSSPLLSSLRGWSPTRDWCARVCVGGTSSGVRPASALSAVQTRDVFGIPCKSPEIRREIFDCKSLNFRSTFSRSRTVNRYSGVMDHVVAFKYRASRCWYRTTLLNTTLLLYLIKSIRMTIWSECQRWHNA